MVTAGRRALVRVVLVVGLGLGLGARVAAAQPGFEPGAVLHEANAAASTGEWSRVEQLVDPLLDPTRTPPGSLGRADRAEADRLAGLASFFLQRVAAAETYFVEYLKLDLDGHLDPALYPPEVVNFFNNVRARHASELHAVRPPPKRYWPLALLPPVAQFQNGERAKGIVVGSLLGAFAVTNLTTYLVLRSWCHDTGNTCDASGTDHFRSAQTLSSLNIASGVGFILTAAYGVWDGVRGYRRRSLELVPYASPTNDGAAIGIYGSF